ncbi:MAG: hypothetical protein WC839_01655 [Candidatus Paceibacterota bacterium]
MDTDNLATRDELGHKHILKIEVWRDQIVLAKLIDLLEADTKTRGAEKLFYLHFLEPTSKQLNTFIIFSSEEEYLTPYKEISVRKNRYDDDY